MESNEGIRIDGTYLRFTCRVSYLTAKIAPAGHEPSQNSKSSLISLQHPQGHSCAQTSATLALFFPSPVGRCFPPPWFSVLPYWTLLLRGSSRSSPSQRRRRRGAFL